MSIGEQRTESSRAIVLFKKRVSMWIPKLVIRQGNFIGMMNCRLLLISMISIAQAAPLR
jgi:hypothetical protein